MADTPTPIPPTLTPVVTRTPFPTATLTQTPVWWPTPTLLPTSAATNPFGDLPPTMVEEYARIAEQAVQAYNLSNQSQSSGGLNQGLGYIDWLFITFIFVVVMIGFLRFWKRIQSFGQNEQE